MTGMIRLRPTQIILTSEEVSKTSQKVPLVTLGSPSFSGPLPWDHNITTRRNRNKKIGKEAQYFGIHEDGTIVGEADSGEISEMSDFSFGPTLLEKNPLGVNSLFTRANSSSEAGDEGSGDDVDDEYSSMSISCNGRNSARSHGSDLILLPSTCVDGSISSVDGRTDSVRKTYLDSLTEYELNSVQDSSFVDIEYLADVELSVVGDDAFSGQDSDLESRVHESYSLPMDGTTECMVRGEFAGMNLYASPIPLNQSNDLLLPRGDPFGRAPGSLGHLDSTSTPLTPPLVRELAGEVSPRLEDVTHLSSCYLDISDAHLARYRSQSLQDPILTRQISDHEETGHHRRSRTSDMSHESFFSNSPPPHHSKCRVTTPKVGPPIKKRPETCVSNSNSYVKVVGYSSGAVGNKGDEDSCDDSEGANGTGR